MKKRTRIRTWRDFRRTISRSECVKRYRKAAKRVLRAERELNRATESYEDMVEVARANEWRLPRTVLSNPFLR